MADVFISYARSSARSARAAADALRSAGLTVWFDEDLPATRAYAEVISERLDEARAVLVLWSEEAARSHWVRSEADRARKNGTLVQARLDGARLPMPFDQIQCADLGEWGEDPGEPAWQRLEQDIAELAGRGERTPEVRPVPLARGRFDRRAMLAGGAAAVTAAAGAGGLYWYRSSAPDVPPRAQQLVQSAFAIMQDGRPEEQDQAIAYLLEATQIAPTFPRAWGALAVTYALRKYQVPIAERAGAEARCRSAARTAFSLEPRHSFAECALALLVPPYRNWDKVHVIGKDLTGRHPEIPLSHHILADSLVDVGRWKDAVPIYDRIDRTHFVIPLSDRSIIQGLWGAGDLQRAEAMLKGAAERWPRHRAVWNLHADFLMHTGRPGEALRLLDNAAGRPPGYPDDLLSAALATARGLAGLIAPAEAVAANLEMLAGAPPAYLTYLNHKIARAQVVAQRAAALGDSDTALALLDGYHFGRGRWAQTAPAAGDEDRNSITLFEPPMSALWRHPRFENLLREIGLEDHWRRTRSMPDFRKG